MIQIDWTNIKKDVDKQTYRLASVHIDDAHADIRDRMQEDDTQSSLRFIARFCIEGIALVRTAIKDVLINASGLDTIDNLTATDHAVWQFEIKKGDEGVCCTLIHKAIVDYILWRWCLVWLPNFAASFNAEYVSAVQAIQNEVFRLDWCVKEKRPEYPIDKDEINIEYV